MVRMEKGERISYEHGGEMKTGQIDGQRVIEGVEFYEVKVDEKHCPEHAIENDALTVVDLVREKNIVD